MTDVNQLGHDLDVLEGRASRALRSAAQRRGWRDGLRRALPLLAVVPAVVLFVSLLRYATGTAPAWVPWLAVAFVALCAPFISAWVNGARAGSRPIARRDALGVYDAELDLEDRLVTADEFRARPAVGPFEVAAVDDAVAHLKRALSHGLKTGAREDDEPIDWFRVGFLWGALGAALLVLCVWVGGLTPAAAQDTSIEDDVTAAAAGDPLTATAPQEREARDEDPPEDPPVTAADASPRPSREREPGSAERSPELSDDVKESSGKSGAGRSGGALSTSAASQSRSSPSSQGQSTKPPERKPKPKKPQAKRPEEPKEEPKPREQQEEESGSTAGRGSSKGSNKNPTASDWKSKDQVTNEDDQEIEDDEETDDEDEEQENRGGLQPNLRDRRPPVSRDLQIGFGNRPSPDANGRGGPSQPKKSRGVASLVLGVPIPDRIKGQPGPGPTKITQERIEPEGEDADPVEASARAPRATPVGPLSSPDLEPWMRDLVRSYFLSRRQQAPSR